MLALSDVVTYNRKPIVSRDAAIDQGAGRATPRSAAVRKQPAAAMRERLLQMIVSNEARRRARRLSRLAT